MPNIIPFNAIKDQPLIQAWMEICPNLRLAIESGHIIGITIYPFPVNYLVTVSDSIDHQALALLRYIGVSVTTEQNSRLLAELSERNSK